MWVLSDKTSKEELLQLKVLEGIRMRSVACESLNSVHWDPQRAPVQHLCFGNLRTRSSQGPWGRIKGATSSLWDRRHCPAQLCP